MHPTKGQHGWPAASPQAKHTNARPSGTEHIPGVQSSRWHSPPSVPDGAESLKHTPQRRDPSRHPLAQGRSPNPPQRSQRAPLHCVVAGHDPPSVQVPPGVPGAGSVCMTGASLARLSARSAVASLASATVASITGGAPPSVPSHAARSSETSSVEGAFD